MRPHTSDFVRGRLDALPAVTLRPITDGDLDFLRALYASTRSDELAPLPWTAEQKRGFLDQQFELQHRHYHSAHPQAEFLLILEDAAPIGRIYLERSTLVWSLIDIALVAERRGRGLGSVLIAQLLREARATQSTVDLHVEVFNPARRLYERCGFRLVEHRGVYDFLAWSPEPAVLPFS